MSPRPGRLSLVAAVATNGVIGSAGRLPWSLPADLARFRELTTGHHLIVGRRTWESIGRPLAGRTFVVLSRDPGFAPPGIIVARSLAQALAAAANDSEAFVGGGGEVFAAALPLADRLYLTRVHAEVEGDVRFPDLDPADWRLVACEGASAAGAAGYRSTYLTYERMARAT